MIKATRVCRQSQQLSLFVSRQSLQRSLFVSRHWLQHSLFVSRQSLQHSLFVYRQPLQRSLFPLSWAILSCHAHASISTADHDDDREHGTNKGLCRDLDEADLGRLLSRLMIDGDCRRHVVGQITLQSHTAGASAHTAISGMKAHSRFLLPGFCAHLAVHATAITRGSVLRHIR